MAALTTIAWLLLAVSTAGLTFWLVVMALVGRSLVGQPTVRRGLESPRPEGAWPRLSIIVPAHNEEQMIDACARSLREQEYDNLEIVFVLDRCTDATAERLAPHAAADPRVVIVENDTCPEEWAGKCHAAQCGADRATGEWLLFTDADTRFDPKLARAAVALALERRSDLLSLLTTLTAHHRFERIVQPVAVVNLARMYPIERVNRAERTRPFANGQFMLFRRSWYERLGGHAAVRDALLEDIAFARLLHRRGGRGALVLADGMLVCSMYDSLGAFKAGWKRIFIEACGRKPARLRKNGWRVLVSGIVFPLIQLATLITAAAVALNGQIPLGIAMVAAAGGAWLAQTAALLRVYPLGGAPRLAVLWYPAGCWIVGRLMLAAASDLEQRRPVIWGGKQYVLAPR